MQNKTKRSNASKKVIENLRLKKEKIFHKQDIFKVIREYENIYKQKINIISLWTYLRKGNYIKRILSDYYYVYSLEERHNFYCQYSEEELVFLVLQTMDIRWYLGLERALIENKISWQALNTITIINDHFSGIKRLGNSKFKFIKTKQKMFKLGLLSRKTNNRVKYFYSDLEKTYLDFLYFGSYEGKDIKAIINNIDFKADKGILAKYSKIYSKKIRCLYGLC